MGSDQKKHADRAYSIDLPDNDNGGFRMEQRRSNPQPRYKPQRSNSKRMYIILGVVVAVLVIAIVAVVVPFVVIDHQNDSSSSHEKKAVCGPYSYPGVNISALTPQIITYRKTCPLKGDCWTGEQCYECFKRPVWKVGNINNIPVCCKNCEVTGLGMSGTECNCLHNGYSYG